MPAAASAQVAGQPLPVLLVLVGALGDLAFRKFLQSARELQEKEGATVLLIDRAWQGVDPACKPKELEWRIGRRLIELSAEELDKQTGYSNLSAASTLFPWEIDRFVDKHLSVLPSPARAEIKKQVNEKLAEYLGWFRDPPADEPLRGVARYCGDLASIGGTVDRLKKSGWRIVVFAATPPIAYPAIIDEWAQRASKIVLEKPASGLKQEGSASSPVLNYAGTKEVREAAQRARRKGVEVVTNDHYNSKLMVRILDRLSDYGLFRDLLDPPGIERIVIQLLEDAPLPAGRCKFYNEAGGPFGDMVPHMIQVVRALFGMSTKDLVFPFERFEFAWGRDEGALASSQVSPRSGHPYSCDPGYYAGLLDATETFVAFMGCVIVGGVEIPLFGRTGKGIHPSQKSLRVDTTERVNGTKPSLIFDFGQASVKVWDGPSFHLATGRLDLGESSRPGVPLVYGYGSQGGRVQREEYTSVFSALIESARSGAALDTRFFPALGDAADLADQFFEALVKARKSRPSGKVARYSPDDPRTLKELTAAFDDEALWG